MEGTAEIAARLGVSRQTVWGYRSSRTKRGDAKLREALEAEGVRLPKPRGARKDEVRRTKDEGRGGAR